MSTESHPYTVVVGIDFCPACEAAVTEAFRATGDRPDSEVHAIHVIDQSEGGLTRSVRIKAQEVELEELPAKMRLYVAEQARALGHAPGKTRLGIHVRIGKPVDTILQLAVDTQADLVIVGAHGREGLKRFALGSVAEQLMRNAHCPVLVARPIDYEGLKASERITPPCPDCLAVRKKTAGAEWWCERHHEAMRQPHIYSGMAPVHWTAGSVDIYGAGTSVTQI